MKTLGKVGNFRPSLPCLVYVAAFVSALALARPLLTDQDAYWHIVAGRWILAHQAVPHSDVFSSSMPGAPWVPHQWLGEVIIALVYDRLGWAGLVVMTAMTFAAALAMLSHFLLRIIAPIYAIPLVVSAWGLCLAHLHARPNVFGLPLLVIWFALLDRTRLAGRTPSPFLAAIIVLWANLHASYMTGLALAALLAGEAAFEATSWRQSLRTAAGWGGFLLIALVAAFATPNGAQGVMLPLGFLQSSFSLHMINEWRSPDFQMLQPLEIWILLALLAAVSLGLRLPVTRVIILIVLMHIALAHQRFAETLGLVAPLLVAPALAAQLAASGSASLQATGRSLAMPAGRGGLALTCLVVVVLGAAFVSHGIDNENNRFAPSAAVAFIKRQAIAAPVFNDYEFGGYLIYSGIAPFVDGRADMYGDAFLRRYADVGALPAILDQYRIGWTLLDPNDPRTALLDHLQGWQRIYGDAIAVVHRRDAPH